MKLPKARKVATRLLMTVALYGFIGWAYIAGNAISHAQTLYIQLSHLTKWPREGDFGLACFIVSAVAYFALQLVKDGRADE
jgi:hypothetical protein